MASKVPVLLLGGHGKVSQLITKKLLSSSKASYAITSVIRNPDQTSTLEALKSSSDNGSLNVLVRSLDEIKSESDAASLIAETKPSVVIWSAGAGGKGGESRTWAIDRDAAKAVMSAAVDEQSGVDTLLIVSSLAMRKKPAPWWDDGEDIKSFNGTWKAINTYCQAKLDADEYLVSIQGKAKSGFRPITLRPGTLNDEAGTGKVSLGRTHAIPQVTRDDVAAVAVALVENSQAKGWFDLVQGEEKIEDAVERVVRDEDTAEE